MMKRRRKLLSLLLALCLVVCLLPVSAFAAGTEDYITVFDLRVDAGKYFVGSSRQVVSTAPDSNYLYYEGGGKIMLNSFVYTNASVTHAIQVDNKNISITLTGQSSVTNSHGISSIVINNGKLIFSGDGSLSCSNSIDCSGFELADGTVTASGVSSAGNISISGGELTLTSNALKALGNSAISISDGKVTVSGNKYGIFVTSYDGTVSITGGEVELTARDSGSNGDKAIFANTITIGENMQILAGSSANNAAAVDAYNGEMYVKIIPKAQAEDNVITLTPADLWDGASGEGWSFSDDTLTIEYDFTLVFDGECSCPVLNLGTILGGTFTNRVHNNGTIIGGTFSGYVDNYHYIKGGNFSGSVDNDRNATIYGGVFTGNLTSPGTVTGTVDLSTLRGFSDYGGKYGKQVKLPKAEIKGALTYTGCESSTQIALHYYADGDRKDTWTVNGDGYSYEVEGYKRTSPDDALSSIEGITHEVKAAPMDGYEITVTKENWDRFNVTVALPHTHTYGTEWKSDGTSHWHAATCGHDVVSDKAAHNYGNDRTCDSCGYRKPVAYFPPASVEDAPLVESAKTGDSLLLPLLVLCLSLGGFAVVMAPKRRTTRK